MEKAIIREIKENILNNNPNTFVRGYSILRQLQNGKVIEWTQDGKVVGLKDNEYNYFYFRYRDEPTTDEPSDRTTSCNEYEVSVPLRLLAWVKHGNETKLKEVLIYDLTHTDYVLNESEQKLITKIYPIQIEEIITNKERIFLEETLQEKITLAKNVTLLAIDFILRFNHKPYQHVECLDRSICEDCGDDGANPVPLTLCGMIQQATAQTVVDCLTSSQRTAIENLICTDGGDCEYDVYVNGVFNQSVTLEGCEALTITVP